MSWFGSLAFLTTGCLLNAADRLLLHLLDHAAVDALALRRLDHAPGQPLQHLLPLLGFVIGGYGMLQEDQLPCREEKQFLLKVLPELFQTLVVWMDLLSFLNLL